MRLELETRRFYLGRDYAEAVHGVGGAPLHLALIPERGYVSSAIAGLDGILLPGSDTDVDPAYYGEEPHPKLGRVIPEKDQTDRLVIEECERLRIPVFAICFGMQALNVWRGGTLVQDINSQIDDPVKHQQGAPLARASHTISISEGSLLGQIAGGRASAKVNSHHHQAVRMLGSNLRAVAWSKDGVVEAIEDPRDDIFAVGVQWHPELSWSDDGISRGLFECFVRACRGVAMRESAVNARK